MCRSNNRNTSVVGSAVVAGREDGVTKTIEPTTTIVATAQIHTSPGTTKTTEDKDAVVITSVEAGGHQGSKERQPRQTFDQMTKAE